jgi:hypothetical protein
VHGIEVYSAGVGPNGTALENFPNIKNKIKKKKEKKEKRKKKKGIICQPH